ncbi:MAG TPA: hypothetical protein VK631_28985 [Solirubrobacteraceae bacterium]|nr:hypothetical protein [Solirubrobacteraceae bacterium]
MLRSFDGDASARDVERLVRALEEFSRALDRVGWMPYDDEKSPRPIDVLCRELARAVAERDDVHARHVAWAIRRACGLHRAGPLL